MAAVPFAADARAEVSGLPVAMAAYESSTPLAASPQEDIVIKGRVVDEQGNPLPGVTIAVQGTTKGTISDVNGNFEVSAPEDAILDFSFKGYFAQQVEVSGREVLGDIVLTKDVESDLVNVAFRKVSEDDILGSISYVNVEENMKTNYSTGALDYMESYVSGWNGSTLWGMNPENSSYFIVVDGVPRGLAGYENLLSTEIESITFLKGADAVALYGSRGAKGAILITTKRGKVRDGLEINSRVFTGFNVAKSYPQYLCAAEYMTLYNAALKGDGLDPIYSDEDIYNHASGKNPYRYPDVDYYSDEYISKVMNHTDVNVELVGGSERAKYYGSINYWTAGDYLKVGDAKDNRTHRYSVRGNVDVKIADFIKAYINANATFYDVKTAGNANWWSAAASQRPNRPANAAAMIPVDMVDPDNQAAIDLLSTTKNIYDGKFLSGTLDDKTSVFGDIYAAGSRKYTIRKFQFDAGLDFDLAHLLPGLSLKTIMGMDFSTQYTTAFSNAYAIFIPEWASYNGKEYIVGLTKEGEDSRTGYQSVSGSDDDRMINVTGMFDYKRSFGLHNVNGILLASGSQQTELGTYHSDCSAHIGFQAAYNYAHKYYADFSSALVHSVRLAKGHRNVFSPSLTLGWDMAKESFLEGSFVDKLQLEASASILHEDYDIIWGSDKYYLYNGAWQINEWGFTYGDGKAARAATPTRGNNDELEMIKRKEVRFGLRSSFLKGMVTFTGNYFQNNMEGYLILSGSNLPAHMVNFVALRNNDIVHRDGFDFEVTFNKKFGEVDFSMGVYGTHYNTKRTKYEETVKYDNLAQEGTPEDAFWGFKCLGIFQTQEEIDNSPVQNLGAQVRPGDLKYDDTNGDGEVNTDDIVQLGKYGMYGDPTSLGVNLTAKWKNFSFFVSGYGGFGATNAKGGVYFVEDGTASIARFSGYQYYQMDEDDKYSVIARDCWRADNTNAKYPRISSKANSNNYAPSDFWTFKRNVFYLDKIQVTYELPSHLFAGAFIKGVSVFASGANLLTISKEREWQELSIGSSPRARYYGVGVQAKF